MNKRLRADATHVEGVAAEFDAATGAMRDALGMDVARPYHAVEVAHDAERPDDEHLGAQAVTATGTRIEHAANTTMRPDR